MATDNSETFSLRLVGDLDIEMTRQFSAPRRLVFLAHTSCEHMKRWWGPRHLTVLECSIDFRVGGKWRIVQRDAEGNQYAFRGEYREIVPDELITWTFEFEGMPGSVAIETMTLTEKDGRTTLKAISRAPNQESRDGMAESGMESGARETWDRLEELLPELK
ncbi:MAG: SRPBCC family protein [Planctomycetes bacterium]|nr:SRPBCC family protein [Planctomycetota bacterium]